MVFVGARFFFVGARCFLCVRHAFCWLARGAFVVLCAVVFCALWFLSRTVFFVGARCFVDGVRWFLLVPVFFLLLRGVSSQ